ncbi:NACHT domain-containing protein [Streptomyces sp. NBC_01483]|uniref:NACHT domain-containing protein n=1 Tax=Streptomyces sp. NBC_01483 TaxID=2903883 RepID=UPI002E3140ED|nr:NACHT domain-containing protein [Streptomyces sp. NBC_01483]
MVAVLLTGAVLAVAVLNRDFTDTTRLTTVLGFLLSVTGLALGLLREGPPRSVSARIPVDVLNQVAEQLAAAAGEQWQSEWRLRRLQDPNPLRVEWIAAEAWLADHGQNIGGELADLLNGAASDDIVAVHARVPSQRLVVIGEPGSGKSILALRFTLDTLNRRGPGEPVPVIFLPSTWQPDREGLYEWLAAQLAAHYPGLATADGQRTNRAEELLRAGLVLPVLDGLDEMPEQLQGAALRRLNAELDAGSPLLLTCRTGVYEQAVVTGDVFTSAAVAELRPVAFEDAAAYLVRTARRVRGVSGGGGTRWDPVLARLREHPEDPASLRLRAVLSTPLMVAMARSVYNDTDTDTAELLSPRFTSCEDVEAHLLDAFVPAAFADHDVTERLGRSGEDARRWLALLARHMDRHGTRDLAWWELSLTLPRPLNWFGPLLCAGASALAVSGSLLWLGTYRYPEVPLWTAGFIAGGCGGYWSLPRRNGSGTSRSRRRSLFGLALTMVLAVVLGLSQNIANEYYFFEPSPAGQGPVGWIAWGALCGMAAVVVLAAIGVESNPRPAAVPLTPRRRPQSWAGSLLAALSVLLAGGTAFVVPYQLGVPSQTCWTFAVLAALLVAAGAVRRIDVVTRRQPPGASGLRALLAGVSGRSLSRGMVTALFLGLVFGSVFGVVDAAALGIRAAVLGAFPDGTLRSLPDGTRYVTGPRGWDYGRLRDGGRYVRTPPVRGVTVDYADGDRWLISMAQYDRVGGCDNQAQCTRFLGRVEFRMPRDGQDEYSVRAKAPDGTVTDTVWINEWLSGKPRQWLFKRPPRGLSAAAADFGLGCGFVIGVVGGLTSCLYRLMNTPVDVGRAPSPVASLRADRTSAIVRGAIVTAFGVLGSSLLTALLPSAAIGHTAALEVWLLAGPLTVALSAWGWWLTARLWFWSTGQLPLGLMGFLEEAHRRGVLRQAGAVYQFRHVRLQERLAEPSSRPLTDARSPG